MGSENPVAVVTVQHVLAILSLKDTNTAPQDRKSADERLKIYNANHGDVVMKAIKERAPEEFVPIAKLAQRANEIRAQYLAELNKDIESHGNKT